MIIANLLKTLTRHIKVSKLCVNGYSKTKKEKRKKVPNAIKLEGGKKTSRHFYYIMAFVCLSHQIIISREQIYEMAKKTEKEVGLFSILGNLNVSY